MADVTVSALADIGRSSAAGDAEAKDQVDPVTLGRRLRHFRTLRGMTLSELGAEVGTGASQLSLVENGHREPRISQLRAEALVLLRGALAEALEPHLAERPADPAGVVARRRATYASAVAARHAARRPTPAERSA